jgi:hypothetical protein
MKIGSRFSVRQTLGRGSPVRWLLQTSILLVVCSGLWTVGARAQGSRKDDVVFNAQGRPMAGATVRICASGATGQPCSPLANIYSDVALTHTLANPLTTDGLGNYAFYATPGRYEIEISGANITTEQFPNVILPNDPSTPTFTTLSTTSGISALSLSLGGNLTVNGSAAITGTLTVGGGPIPSTGQANTWTAPQTFQGPTPWVDVAAYGARAIVPTGYTTTCSVSASSTALGCAGAAQFHNGDGISVYGAGAANTLGTPGAPAVTPSLAAHATGTGIDVSAPSGSTSFSYKIVALGSWSATSGSNLWGAYTVAGSAGATTTGNALGSQTQTISTLSEQNGVLTVTCSAACPMTAGAVVQISGTSDSGHFDGQPVVASVINNTEFTANIGYSTPYVSTATGGTLGWFQNNHITWSAVSGAFNYAIYKLVGGTYTLVGLSWPDVTWWDDFGSTMSGNFTGYGWLPTTAPSTAENGVLTTTVTAGGGTTSLTLATAASSSVSSSFATFDDAPLFAAASNAAIIGGPGPLLVSCNSAGGEAAYVIGSYLKLNPSCPTSSINVRQCGALQLDDPFEWDAFLNWFGTDSGNTGDAAGLALTSGALIDVNTAYPGLYMPNVTSIFVDHVFLNYVAAGSNNALLSYLYTGGPGIIWENSTWQTGNPTDYMGIHMVVAPVNGIADFTFTNDSWIAGPNQVPNLTTTPTVIFESSPQVHIDNCTVNRRGIAEIAPSVALHITKGCWVQGPITPFAMSNASSIGIGGVVVEGIVHDTSGQPIFANWSPAVLNGTVEIKSPDLNAPNEIVTGTGIANLVLEEVGLPASGSATLGQTQNYELSTEGYLQSASANSGALGGVQENSKPVYQGQPNPQNYFIEQIPPAPSSSASSGGSLTGTHYYGVVALFPNGTSRTGPQGNSVALSGGNGTIVSTWSPVPGAVTYDVWDLTRGLPTACVGLTSTTCTDNGGVLTASGIQPNVPTDGCPAMTPSGLFNCSGPVMAANPPAALTDGATIILNAASQANPWYSVTLGGNRTLNVSGMVAGGNYKLFVRQPSSGGPDTLALGTGCTWINNPLRWSTSPNSVDLLVWWYDGTNCWALQGTINGPVSYGAPAASAATNFGSAIGSTNLVASVPVTGVYNVGGSAYVSTAGAGCSSATNSATVTWAWTDATGTSQSATGPVVSVSGNSALGATTVSGPLAIVAEAGTAISYSVASTLGSTGCSTTPKYTVQLKTFN